ncbi:SUPEROXIDE DISMUTASE [FE] 1 CHLOROPLASTIC [Salix koriyanagi]|uniref:superoxide dismutase n=1 Tax=Salix koriyanagi TaxID=2511006 RepID=A0A9Q0PHU9_9ROSI|nr:SUPEROXIDE DISMUTASE [FE] 1 CHLOROPLASTIC [Salix koriyanagi]
MVAAVAAAAVTTANPLTCSLFPSQGLRGTTSGLQWTKRQCTRKASALTVTAKFELKPPPYPMDALEPHMSKDTFEYHWGKHHRAYGDPLPAFNNAAQAWNHEFFWESMKPGRGRKAIRATSTIDRKRFWFF